MATIHETTNLEGIDNAPKNETAQNLATHLVAKCQNLLSELDSLQDQLGQRLRNPQLVEVRTLRSNLTSELRALEKLARQAESIAAKDGEEEAANRVVHALRSSNLPFHEAVWSVARNSCTGLVAFGTRFYWGGEEGAVMRGEKRPNKDKKKSVLVDIVADDGEEWVKVSTISESRLLFEMAKKGWERDSDSEDDDEGGRGRTVLQNYDDDGEGDDDDDEIELLKLASDMRKAVNATRVRYRHPQIRFVLTKIVEGGSDQIDGLLKEIRSFGITVECGGNMTGSQTEGVVASTKDSPKDLSHLLPNPFKRFTSPLNVDCTLLLAIVSDLSHFKEIPAYPSLHKAILRQMEVEKQQPLLPAELWPAMGAHELVCTEEAATRMREIVNIIGTDTEKKRTEILMGDSCFRNCDTETLIQKFQELSHYQVPAQWKLPVNVVESQSVIDQGKAQGKLPGLAEEVVKILSDINHSVFFYGWVTGLTTISSNRTVVREIEAIVEEHRNGDDNLEGPPVWVCNTARSLIGKDKDRKI